MMRLFALTLGLAALILGGEFMVIDKATLLLPAEAETQQRPFLNTVHETFYTKEFVPPEWAPWTLISVGAVIVLYSGTVARE